MGFLNAGFNYRFARRWSAIATVDLRYHFTPLAREVEVRNHLYSYGLTVRVLRRLGN